MNSAVPGLFGVRATAHRQARRQADAAARRRDVRRQPSLGPGDGLRRPQRRPPGRRRADQGAARAGATRPASSHVTLYLLATDNLQPPGRPSWTRCCRSSRTWPPSWPRTATRGGCGWSARSTCCRPTTRAALKAAEERTVGRDRRREVNIAVGYGGRREIADAVRSLLHEHAAAGGTHRGAGRDPRRRPHRRAPLHPRPARPRPGHPHQRRAAAVRLPAVAVGALGVLLLRRELAGLPAHRLPAGAALVRRPPAPLRRL